jgi:CelD/BcsL family acetyltransferase involved in cellulose biosynthesis
VSVAPTGRGFALTDSNPTAVVQSGQFETVWVADPDALGELRAEWDALAEREGVPSLRHAWFAAWWQAFGRGALRVCTLRRDGELVGAFPLAATGGRLEALAHVHHTPVFLPLARDEDALDRLVAAVAGARAGELVVPCLPEGSRGLAALERAARSAGRLTLLEPQHTSPVAETRADYETYQGELDGRKRRELDRLRRKLESEHGAVLAFGPPGDVDVALDRALELETAGWKGTRGTAIAQDEATARFYRTLARSFAAEGRLRLATIEVDGGLVAFDLSVVDGRRLWVLKGAYDERYARYGPGSVLTAFQLERCHELGLRALELCGDVERWKLVFANGERRHRAFRAYRRRPLPAARFAYRRYVRPLLWRAYYTVRPIRRGRA